MRWILPAITTGIAVEWEFDLTPYHPLLVSYLIVQLAPLVPGIIGAFLLLESREDGTVKALLVSPNPLTSYLAVVGVVMFVTAGALTVVQGAIIGLALPAWPALMAVGLAATPWALIFALLTAAVSDNKVQAFAYLKLFGVGPLLATGAYFLPEPWQWLAAIYLKLSPVGSPFPTCFCTRRTVANRRGLQQSAVGTAARVSRLRWFPLERMLELEARLSRDVSQGTRTLQRDALSMALGLHNRINGTPRPSPPIMPARATFTPPGHSPRAWQKAPTS